MAEEDAAGTLKTIEHVVAAPGRHPGLVPAVIAGLSIAASELIEFRVSDWRLVSAGQAVGIIVVVAFLYVLSYRMAGPADNILLRPKPEDFQEGQALGVLLLCHIELVTEAPEHHSGPLDLLSDRMVTSPISLPICFCRLPMSTKKNRLN